MKPKTEKPPKWMDVVCRCGAESKVPGRWYAASYECPACYQESAVKAGLHSWERARWEYIPGGHPVTGEVVIPRFAA